MRLFVAGLILTGFVGVVRAETSISSRPDATSGAITDETLTQGRYQVNAGFEASGGASAEYMIDSSAAYFFQNKRSVSLDLRVQTAASSTILGTGFGIQQYFLTSKSLAPFVSQAINIVQAPPASFTGRTSLGILYLLAPQVGFRTSANLSYPLAQISLPAFDVTGDFSFFF